MPENDERISSRRSALGYALMPMALVPLLALLTYNWRAVGFLQTPPEKCTNLFGMLGNYFAYYGYTLVGFSVWLVPALFLRLAFRFTFVNENKVRKSDWWIVLFMLAVSILLQISQTYLPAMDAAMHSLNVANAGGVIGYLLVDKLLAPSISAFGTTMIALILLTISVVLSIDFTKIAAAVRGILKWAVADGVADKDDALADERAAELEAMQRAREEAALLKSERKKQMIAARKKAQQAFEEEKPCASDISDGTPAQSMARRSSKASSRVSAKHDSAMAADAADGWKESAAREEKEEYRLPPVDLLDPLNISEADHSDVNEMCNRLIETLTLFNIEAKMSYTVQGPVVTKYAVALAPGTRYNVVTNISANLKGALHARSLRIEAPIPGEEYVGIEVPNKKPASISFREIIESDEWKYNKAQIPLLLGKRADGQILVADLASMPHMLVAGATGQGKSVCLNSIINGLLMTKTPEQLKLIMVDPKSVEFTPYASIPHLLVPVITDNRKVVFSLHWAVAEMEKRLKLFSKCRVRNIYDFNHRKKNVAQDNLSGEEIPETVPYIVIIIDEVADLMATSAKDVTPDIGRLAAKARAAGIHLILATQRPEAKIINGTIKSNIPGRVAFKTSQAVDSRTILDESGAEDLIGRGDMLFKGKDSNLIRAQGAWLSDDEIERITNFISAHSKPQFDETFAQKLNRVKEAEIQDPFAENEDDPDNNPQDSALSPAESRAAVRANEQDDLYKKAIEVIINTNRASVSHFQRKLQIGYNNAARLCDRLEENGVIGPQASGAGPRTIIMSQAELAAILNGGDSQPEDGAGFGNDDYAASNGEDGITDDVSGDEAEA